MKNNILKLKNVMQVTGLARSTVYLWMKDKTFPTPIKLGERSVGWLEKDIDTWLDERIAESCKTSEDTENNNSEELMKERLKIDNEGNVTEIKPSKIREAIANDWLWNPWLVADITQCIGQSSCISTSQTVQEEGFHYLEWSNSNNKTDVYLQIRDGAQSLIVNTERFRGHNERLALIGIAANYNLIYGECDDE